jgi:hypothetical protein
VLIAQGDRSARSANERYPLDTSCSNEVQLCTRCSSEVSCLLCAEWWDALAWIASLRRWIAPYAATARRPAELDIFQAFAREYRGYMQSRAMCRRLLGKQEWSDLSTFCRGRRLGEHIWASVGQQIDVHSYSYIDTKLHARLQHTRSHHDHSVV